MRYSGVDFQKEIDLRLYKLTDGNGETYNHTQWGEGVTHMASGEGELCSSGWIHAYRDPLIAVCMNPVHARFIDPQLWEAEGVPERDDGCKVGCRELTTLRRIPLPVVTTEQCVKFGILAALAVCKNEQFVTWANAWLSGKDRSSEVAARAAGVAWAAEAPAWAVAWAVARAAEAAWAAKAAREAEAAEAAARAAAEVAAWAAEAAAWAARAAAIDLVSIVYKACT